MLYIHYKQLCVKYMRKKAENLPETGINMLHILAYPLHLPADPLHTVIMKTYDFEYWKYLFILLSSYILLLPYPASDKPGSTP